ncbi:MAG: hypothetical protein RL236_589 [Pseudomonadota bacterium]|jgi:pilus assembly protein FimV
MKKNLRYLTTTLVATSFLVCSPSYALGIGGMKLQSALNQDLKAEIPLILSEGENATDLKIGFASNAKFDEAGIPWTLFLSKIKFQTVTQNGKTIIKLSSKEVLKEPFLDFLIEVRGAKNTVYREFTVLVDPPASYSPSQETATIVPKKNTSNLPHHSDSEPPYFVSAQSPTANGTYGPVSATESLWHIASKFNQQNNISIGQMVEVIYSANQGAFKNKTKEIITGKILTIPVVTAAPILAKNKTKTVVVKVNLTKEKTIIPPVKPLQKVESPVTTEVKKEKTIIPPSVNPAQKIEPLVIAEVVKEKAVITKVKSASKVDTSAITNQKVVELEKQLSNMKKIIAEQNAQIVALKVVMSKTTALKNTVIAPPELPTTIIQTEAVEITVAEPISESALEPVATSLPTAFEVLPVVAPTAIAVGATDSYYYTSAIVGTLLLSLLGWLRFRGRIKTEINKDRRAKPEVAIDEIPIHEVNYSVENTLDQSDDLTSKMFDNDATSEFEDEGEIEFEEQSMSEFNQFMNDDLDKYKVGDVLYKVGIYCAYGSYDKAILLLREEYKKHPDAENYALRLLKLYVLQDNQAEFIGFLFELIKQGKKEIPEFWMQVSDITVRFYPEALFFVTSPEKSNLSTDGTAMDSIVDVSEMSFDQDISFIDVGSENELDELNTDLFEFSVQESVKDYSESELIFFNEALSFDPIQKDPLEELSFNLDFTALEVEKEMIIDVPDFEFDINFTTHEIEKEAVVYAPKFEFAFDLDFVTFDMEKMQKGINK